jgi:tryptophan halogenase
VNIVIAGGGTAGWISAYIIEKSQPGVHKLTIIESSAIGIVGAGEGSTGLLYDLVSGSFFGEPNHQEVIDFMNFTDSTHKFGINHLGWSSKRESGYFAPLDGSPTNAYAPDAIFNYVLAKYGTERAYLASYMGQSYAFNKFPKDSGFGFHFDAHKVGKYFRSKLEGLDNVRVIDSKIKEVLVNQNGEIDSLVLDQGAKISADFFVDSTGFSRVLLSKINVGWKSYRENLIANKAMPFLLNYTEKTKKGAKPYTTAQAMSSGWMWDIPLKTRRGCGYVYNSSFLSEDDAQKEVEKFLGQEIEPIRHLSFDAGRSEKLWSKNCLASGLSAAFMEPLEATSIHSTILQMITFTMDYLSDTKEKTVNEANIDSYNKKFEILYESYKDFLVLHYQGGRSDSEFWKYLGTGITITPFVKEVMGRAGYRLPSHTQYEHKWGTSTILWNWILAGLDFVTSESSAAQLKVYNRAKEAEKDYLHFFQLSTEKNTGQEKFSISNMVKLPKERG